MHKPNLKRAIQCDAIITGYSDDEDEINLIDLLADAMNWAGATGGDFHISVSHACRHYIHELNDQQHNERRMVP